VSAGFAWGNPPTHLIGLNPLAVLGATLDQSGASDGSSFIPQQNSHMKFHLAAASFLSEAVVYLKL
jgi:hypothetical protein